MNIKITEKEIQEIITTEHAAYINRPSISKAEGSARLLIPRKSNDFSKNIFQDEYRKLLNAILGKVAIDARYHYKEDEPYEYMIASKKLLLLFYEMRDLYFENKAARESHEMKDVLENAFHVQMMYNCYDFAYYNQLKRLLVQKYKMYYPTIDKRSLDDFVCDMMNLFLYIYHEKAEEEIQKLLENLAQ